MELSPTFVTKIPHLFGLPDLPNNISEGYVFKPNYEINVSGSRIIMKHKSPLFREKSDKKVRIPTQINVTPEHHELIDKICMYVNENRINNVLSKLDDIEQMIDKKIVGLIVQDVIKDMEKDLDPEELIFFKKEKRIVMPQIHTHCHIFYNEHFKETLNI